MKILQLIDSLRPGGAEQMAVSYANAFSGRSEGSFLCCTRMEGLLKVKLSPDVGYLFLFKKSSLDVKAYMRLRKFVQENRIDIIQAHSSSFFLAVLVKWSLPEIKLVWHDHFGRDLENRKVGVLKYFSKHFDGIISVNQELKKWAEEILLAKKSVFISNFFTEPYLISENRLKGNFDFNILCIANLRPQKDHLTLLKAFSLLKKDEISLHLIGKDENDFYSAEIKKYIAEHQLENNVFLYGEQPDVSPFLKGADLGVLSSSSEGLPVALLEYGSAGLPVVCTAVGQCPEVVGTYGKLVPPQDPEALADGIKFYLDNKEIRLENAKQFHNKIVQQYSEEAVFPEVMQFFSEIEKNS